MNFLLSLFFLMGMSSLQAAEEIQKISLPLIPDLQQADLYILKLSKNPKAILVLCPGFNGNGRDWVQNPLWQKFAQDHNLDLVGLSFASDGDLLKKGRGYYYPSQGSGQLLLDGINRKFDPDIPLLLYGFSGGAHFTSSFVQWKPERVMGWCAYSAEWWDKPLSNKLSPPGLVACGDEDERNGASLIYFKQGRSLGKPWLWVSAAQTDHVVSSSLDEFVRHYFAALLDASGSSKAGQWVDIDFKTNAEQSTVTNQPTLTGWLPSEKLLTEWREIHQP